MHLIPLPVSPALSHSFSDPFTLESSAHHVHDYFFLESVNAEERNIKLFDGFNSALRTMPFRLMDITERHSNIRFLGMREAKFFRRNEERVQFEWFANLSGLHLPLYFLGDKYIDKDGRKYIVSLTRTHKGLKRGFVPTDVLVGGLGEFPKILMYK